MKYGESVFDILYLLFALAVGVWLLCRRRDGVGRLMGAAALVLGTGDAFHLVPRVLGYWLPGDYTFWLGAGKLVTSLTMTVFYVLLYHVNCRQYAPHRLLKGCTAAVYALAAARFVLCALPQIEWFTNQSSVLWGTLRNLPFAALGVLVAVLFFRRRRQYAPFARVWLYVTLSFAFYLPVAVGASLAPMLGMLMLPKTVCYMLLLGAFCRAAGQPGEEERP